MENKKTKSSDDLLHVINNQTQSSFFILENSIFDKLKTPNEIALYALIEKLSNDRVAFNIDRSHWFFDVFHKISEKDFNEALEGLIKIGYLRRSD
jgi:hypothetical protein